MKSKILPKLITFVLIVLLASFTPLSLLNQEIHADEDVCITGTRISDEDSESINAAFEAQDPEGIDSFNRYSRDYNSYSSPIVRDFLTANQRAFYDKLVNEGISTLTTTVNAIEYRGDYVLPEINYSSCGVTMDEAGSLYRLFKYNNPQFYYLDNAYYYDSKSIYPIVYTEFVDGNVRMQITNQMFDILDGMVNRINEASYNSIIDKEMAIHDFVCDWLYYDIGDPMSQTLYSAIFSRDAVCMSYSYLTLALLSKCGFESMIATSYNHAWNIVKIDGRYFGLDVTWDDTDSDYYYYGYFNASNDKLNEDGQHEIEYYTEDFYPSIDAHDYSYYITSLSKPTFFALMDDSGTLHVKINKVYGAKEYNVQIATNPEFSNVIEYQDDNTQFTLSLNTNADFYYIKTYALNDTLTSETAYKTVSLSSGVEGFVERLYCVALDRASEPGGFADWVGKLKYGINTGAEVARGFILSSEFINKRLDDKTFVEILYNTFFGRFSDQAGRDNWLNALRSGASREDVMYGFINSTEWANLCLRYGIRSGGTGSPNITITPSEDIYAFVDRLYVTCMHREGDSGGRDNWAYNLANLRLTGTEAAWGFVNSPEFLNSNYSNEEFLNRLYMAFMGREADSAGFNDWLTRLNNGASREEVFHGFAGSNEFLTICSNYGIIR